MANEKLPDLMKVVVLDSYDGGKSLRLEQRPVPKPGPGEVLVKVAASPINPSDLSFLMGTYGFKKPTPTVPGFEGSGVVVQAGTGFMPRFLDGKRVAFVPKQNGDGGWAEYLVTSALLAFPLGASVSYEQGAMAVVNPLTALAFIEIIKARKIRSVVHTAAASALGLMFNRLCQREGIEVINIIRRQEQEALLREEGARLVLNSSDPDFDRDFSDLCRQYQCKLAFDAVSGELTMRILEGMPYGSRVIVYGGLSFQPAQADPRQLIFGGKSVEGFWLSSWLRNRNMLKILRLRRQVQSLLNSTLKSAVREEYSLEEVKQAIQTYQSQMSGGKILLRPNGSQPQ